MTPAQQDFDRHLAAGDHRAATEWLVRAHGHDVMRLCVSLVRDPRTAEDLAQDAFGKAFTALGGFRGEASAKTWLLTIARHRCLDHLRRQARQPFLLGREEDLRDHPPADEVPLLSELLARRADLGQGLAALGEAERALVVLRYAHGLSYDELASSFGIKPGTARMRVARALEKMRGAIDPPFAGAAPRAAPMPPAGAAPMLPEMQGYGGRGEAAPKRSAAKGGFLSRLRGAFDKPEPASPPAQRGRRAEEGTKTLTGASGSGGSGASELGSSGVGGGGGPQKRGERDALDQTAAPLEFGGRVGRARELASTRPTAVAGGPPQPAATPAAPPSLAERFGAALGDSWVTVDADEQSQARLLRRVREAFTRSG